MQRWIRNQRVRRVVAGTLIVAGGALMLFAPSVGPGLIAFGAGVALELLGLIVERGDRN
jgi:hypothetical protein